MLEICGGLGKKELAKAFAFPSLVLISVGEPLWSTAFRVGTCRLPYLMAMTPFGLFVIA
jgi:hypothetical protein